MKRFGIILLLVLLFSTYTFANTTGDAGFLAPVLEFVNQFKTGLKIIVISAAIIYLIFAAMRAMGNQDPNQLILPLIALVFAVVLVIKSEDIVKSLGGSKIPEKQIIEVIDK